MSRTRPRRSRTHAGKTAVTLATLTGLGVGLMACSNSGSTATSPPASSPVTSSSPVAPTTSNQRGSDVASDPGLPTPFASTPQPTSTAHDRQVGLPAGAGKGGYSECVNGADTVAKFLQSAVFGAVNEFVYRSNLRGAGRLAAKEIPKLRSAKTAFRAKGFPAGHPVIRDIDQEIAAASALITVAAKSDRAALPRVFQQLSTAQDQFNRDTGHHICN